MKLDDRVDIYFNMGHRDDSDFMKKFSLLPGELKPFREDKIRLNLHATKREGKGEGSIYDIKRENYIDFNITGLEKAAEAECEVRVYFSSGNGACTGIKNSDGDIFNFYSSIDK